MTLTEFNEAEFIANRRAEGREEGIAENFIRNINSLISNMGLTLEASCKALGSSVQEYEEAKKLLK